jgi:hypothetical protein
VQNGSGLCLESGWVEFLEGFVRGIECNLIDVIGYTELLDKCLEFSNLLLSRRNDVVDGVDIGRLCFAGNEVDIDMIGDFNISLRNRFEECRL